MKVSIFDLQGNSKEKIDLPGIFKEPVREDLILRAVLSTQSKKRQPYGVDTFAGKRTSAHYHSMRRLDRPEVKMMNREMARMARLHGKVPSHMLFQARFVPQATKGREAHPPKIDKVWYQKINKKEKRKAIDSAIAATGIKDMILKRGHKIEDFKELPIVVEDKFQEFKKTKEIIEFLKKIGLGKELERIKEKKIRAGRGKSRGKKYKIKKGPLIVITEDKGISKAGKNLLGVNICRVENLSAEALAPGAMPGRLTIFTESAIKKLGE